MGQKSRELFEFGMFVLDPGRHLLLREGKAVPLTPKTFDLLRFLVERQGELLSKSELIKALWPDAFVDDSNLTQQIAMIRRALGESAGEDRFITTVPARGYRFTADVRRRAEIEPEPQRDESSPTVAAPEATPVAVPRRPGWPVATVATVLILTVAGIYYASRRKAPEAPVKSLAILPFQNLKADGENDFLGFSLADAVITKLGPIRSLVVRPSSAVEKFRGKTIDIRSAAAELRADVLLTGNFIQDGDDLRINTQLIDVRTENVIWRKSIDLRYSKLLTVHDSVALEIVNGLQLSLSPSEAASLAPDQQVDPVAYEYFLRGVDLYSRNDFPTAIQMLRKSAEMAPGYALTWAHLGRALTANASFELGGRSQYEEAQQAYEKALTIQPEQLESRIFLANFLTDTGKVEQSVPLLRDALKTNPNHAEVHWELGYAYRFGGMLSQSLAECERARSLDPLVKLYSSALNSYLYLGQYDRFLESLPKDTDAPLIAFYRGFGEYHRNRTQEAARLFDDAFEQRPSMLQARLGKALSAGIRGQNTKGIEMAREIEQQVSNRGVGDPEASYKIAQVYAALGDSTAALRVLRSSIENGFFSYPYFASDPLLKPLQGQDEFSRLLEQAKTRHEAFRKKFF
jgi:DNA-binding winged helix-turn-helix (wHTH) protein/TolB-like protein/Flp pilus assembly protein TadD